MRARSLAGHDEDGTNTWRAAARKDDVYRGADAEGAVGYSTALWKGENLSDINHALISVLVKIDPRHEDLVARNPVFLRALTDQAIAMADDMFRKNHPDAVITHA